ncbi:hypothetical protein F2Q68_00014881 [Brassica cretica]|uniref:Uncharacterized protein n=1 Tax=Brassica cretica TaxID=69181 RepID=A0A8S9HJM6_BRACR|nr:hypothetical protein F2Q68_00014881 [Brassica cretica]
MVPRENEWQDVGIAHRASPWRETQKSVSGNNIRTICPSRYLALNDIEEGELESSSSDEDDEAESSDPPQKEIKTFLRMPTKQRPVPATKQEQTLKSRMIKRRAPNQPKKNASNRRH